MTAPSWEERTANASAIGLVLLPHPVFEGNSVEGDVMVKCCCDGNWSYGSPDVDAALDAWRHHVAVAHKDER